MLAVVTAVAGAASITATIIIRAGAPGPKVADAATWLIIEPLVLALLVGVVVRWSAPREAVMSGTLSALGSALWVQRFLHHSPALEATAASATWLIPSLAMGIIAWYMRWSEFTRARDIALMRAEQRSRLAVDLHDYVAHDISEIVARAQAGRAVLPMGDPRVAELLEQIETAGLRALDSMDQTVRILNEDDELVHSARGSIEDIDELVRRFGAVGEVSAAVTKKLNYPVSDVIGAEAYRTVVEALTNVRRHSVHATEVSVVLSQSDAHLLVSISDNGETRGPSGPPPSTSHTGGLGLVAMGERVRRLGGSVEAGPQQPRGWHVIATLPHSVGSPQGGAQ